MEGPKRDTDNLKLGPKKKPKKRNEIKNPSLTALKPSKAPLDCGRLKVGSISQVSAHAIITVAENCAKTQKTNRN